MIELRELAGASRWRGVASQEVYDATPAEARDPDVARRIHWAGDPGTTDPFLQGAYWSLSWTLETVFGGILGGLLNEATVSNVERWNGSDWVPLA